ncbi:MAG: F0F1 ATP synthase subunit B/delta, partial [Actinomycetes bacterium]
MSTFIGQLIGFGVIVLILMKYAAPPVRKLMIAQQEAVRTQLQESAKAAQRLADADSFHAERIELGRVEARQIVDEASADSVRVAELLRLQAEAESERLKGYGDQQVIQLRAQRIRELRAQLGSDALRRAGEIVRERVTDPQERSATVDRFLDELEAMAPVAVAPELSPSELRPASRDALAAVE